MSDTQDESVDHGERELHGENVEDGDELLVDGLVHLDGAGDGHVHDFVVLDADHDVALALQKRLDGGVAHPGREDPVIGRRGAAPLQVC